ncbi:hypothetical protein HAL07_15360 [Helicobacter ailurogastricus]|uniref:Uncharacterized protein n=1 Tax=Helicobacter ailurogastricus TaxID=1578720 RepID=A0A0K2XBZ3_9HELI|nr:hypothetical protein HAL011_02620 [Helicobacter ailurogastricus]CRF42794.1 hypothetical protein HAL013_10020 [Helicobacter ailurogastricus]CRF44850.1 hypothetical protein HAL09_14650 [Helicobacter ailurogastricus]CRF53071.1 hypothetical protein HAL07_15360 [Helicobacter ailurogastricus]
MDERNRLLKFYTNPQSTGVVSIASPTPKVGFKAAAYKIC